MDGYQQGGGGVRMGEKVHGIRMSVQNKQGVVKNSIGNGEAKELICITHGQELRGWNAGGRGCRVEENKGEKKMGQL